MTAKIVYYSLEFAIKLIAILLMLQWELEWWKVVIIAVLFGTSSVFYRHAKLEK